MYVNYATRCPQRDCIQELDNSTSHVISQCSTCKSFLTRCLECRSTNRLLAVYCRACGERLENSLRPMHLGISNFTDRQESIGRLGEFVIKSLGGNVIAQMLAAEGVIIVAFTNGEINLLSEEGDLIFSFKIEDRSPNITLTPALIDGYLYILSGENLLAYDLASALENKDRTILRVEWKASIAKSIIHSPIVVDEKYVFVLDKSCGKATVKAFNRLDGQPAWEYPIDVDPGSYVHLLISGQFLITITQSGFIQVIRNANGHPDYQTRHQRKLSLNVAPYVSRNEIVFIDEEQDIYKLLITHQPSVRKIYSIGQSPNCLALSDKYIAVGIDAGLILLRSDGTFLWSNSSLDTISVTPIIAGDSIFALGKANQGYLFGRSSDNIKSSNNFGTNVGEVIIPPVITRQHILIATKGGKLVSCKLKGNYSGGECR